MSTVAASTSYSRHPPGVSKYLPLNFISRYLDPLINSDGDAGDGNEIIDFCSHDNYVKSSKMQKLSVWEKDNGISSRAEALEFTALTSVLPALAILEKIRYCKSKEIWYDKDTSMIQGDQAHSRLNDIRGRPAEQYFPLTVGTSRVSVSLYLT